MALYSLYYPVHAACRLDDVERLKMLHSSAFCLNSRDNFGYSPIDICAAYTSVKTLHYLLDCKVPVNDCKGFNKPPLMHMCNPYMKWFSPMLMCSLVQGGAQINIRDSLGKTALHYAACKTFAALLAVRTLLVLGADIGIRDNQGKRAYDYTVNPVLREYLLIHNKIRLIKKIGTDTSDNPAYREATEKLRWFHPPRPLLCKS